MDTVWLRYPETGGRNAFPVDAAPAWRARGWEDCDPPGWVDPTREHLLSVPAEPPVPELPAPPTPKTPSRRSAGDTTETEKEPA